MRERVRLRGVPVRVREREALGEPNDGRRRRRRRPRRVRRDAREESRRLKTANTEAYLETVRSLHENQRLIRLRADAMV